MQFAKRDQITINKERQRQEFEPQAMEELRSSIEANGLLHAPVMREEGGKLILVAGERRIKNLEDLWALEIPVRYNGQVVPAGMVPYVTLGELSPLEAEEAELDENLKRKDLTWQEHAAAVGRLHALRDAQRKLANPQDSEAPGRAPAFQSVADTATEILGRSDGSYQDQIRKEILVSKHLDNPLVAKAKDAKEAFKILKNAEEAKRNVDLALAVGATFNVDKHRLFNLNCLDWMAECHSTTNERFDVICTDPPYGMGADDFGDGGGKFSQIEHRYSDSYEDWQVLMRAWCPLSFTVAKPQAHAYVFCDFDRFHELKALMQAAGWYVFRTPLVVHKLNSGRVPLPDQGPRRSYELILYAIKGKKNVTHIYPDVIPVAGDENLTHGAQKPVALYQNLLQRSVRPGDRVLDSFAGTGPVFAACHTMKCEAVGIEQNPEYYGLCLNRLKELKALEQPDLLMELEGVGK